jgi:enoyl-[acyl-carrier protein] reductase III
MAETHMDFQNKIALITSSGRGIGKAIAGVVETEALNHFASMGNQDNILQKFIAHVPAGRLITPAEVAEVVAFLCSPSAAMIVGQTILIDGGYTLPISK